MDTRLVPLSRTSTIFKSAPGESSMAKISSLLMTPATLAIGMTALSWLDSFHCVVAAVALLLTAVLGFLSVPAQHPDAFPRGTDDRGYRSLLLRRTQARASIYYGHVVGLMRGVLLLGVVIVVSFAASFTPGLEALVLDRDRAQIETKLEALEEADDWSAAADLIEARLERRTSRQWRPVLLLRLYGSLVAAGTIASPENAQAFFQRAADLAEREGLNKDLAATHLQRLGLQGALDHQKQIAGDLAQKDVQREAELHRMAADIAHSQSNNATVRIQLAASHSEVRRLDSDLTKLRSEMAKARSDRAQAELDMLIDWGDTLEPLNPLRKGKYQAALALAQSHGFDEAKTKARLSQLEQDTVPAPLPAGARAVFQNIDGKTVSPLTILDLAVQHPTGEAVSALAAKDFRLTAGTTSQLPLTTACLTTPSKSGQVVLLLDHSNSTSGAALTAAKAGAADLLKQLQGVAQVRTLAFATTVSALSDWSDDPVAASSALQQLSTDGNTALRQALKQAADELQHRGGPKAIVLFTDGRDTVGGPEIAELTARCRELGIAVHAIALETAELDRESLSAITQATGGVLLAAGQVGDLPQRFRQAAEALRRPFYRLVFGEFPVSEPWELVIGGTNAVCLSGSPSEPKQ